MRYGETDASPTAPVQATHPVRQLEVDDQAAGQRLDNYLQRVLGGLPRSRIYRLIRRGEVRVNGHRAEPATRLQPRDKVRVPPVREVQSSSPGAPAQGLLQTLAKR